MKLRRTLPEHLLPAALLLAVALAAGCNMAPDEMLLRFTGFHTAGAATTPPLATAEVDATDGKGFAVDATFENRSEIVGGSGGTGIRVYAVQVAYQIAGAAPPASTYATELYVPGATSSGTGTGATTTPGSGTIPGLPLVPAGLKEWLLDNDVLVEDRTELAVTAIFLGRTDEGRELRVEGRIRVVLLKEGGGGGGGGSTPVVTVLATQDADTGAVPLQNGIFIISRTGSTAGPLVVNYTTEGSTASSPADYESIGTSNTIPAGSSTRKINIVISGASTPGLEVKLTIQSGSGYTVGSPSSDTVLIN